MLPPAVPLLAVLAGAWLQGQQPIDVGLSPPAPWHYVLGAGIVVAAIAGLGFPAVRLMRRSGQSENPWKPTPSILESGPYRFTRNPMYLQLVIACLGFAVLLWNPWIALLVPVVVWVLYQWAIKPEERYLEDKFGDAYRAYRRRVRRWL